jgi:hypothetical protein
MQSRIAQVNLVAEATNIHGLIIYLAASTFIFGALVLANHADDQREKRRQAISARHKSCAVVKLPG